MTGCDDRIRVAVRRASSGSRPLLWRRGRNLGVPGVATVAGSSKGTGQTVTASRAYPVARTRKAARKRGCRLQRRVDAIALVADAVESDDTLRSFAMTRQFCEDEGFAEACHLALAIWEESLGRTQASPSRALLDDHRSVRSGWLAAGKVDASMPSLAEEKSRCRRHSQRGCATRVEQRIRGMARRRR